MSDKTFWLNKAVKRQYKNADIVYSEVGGAPSWMTTVTAICVAALIFLTLTYFTSKTKESWMLIAIVVAGVVGLGAFVLGKVLLTRQCKEFAFTFEDKEMLFQAIGKNHMFFACEDTVIEFKNRKANKVDSIYKPLCSYNAVVSDDLIYNGPVHKGESWIWTAKKSATENGKEKSYVYKVKLDKNNKMTMFSVNGQETTVFTLRKGEQRINLPLPLYNAIKAEGYNLPGQDYITLEYKY